MPHRLLTRALIFALALVIAHPVLGQPIVAGGFAGPTKLDRTPGHNLLVAEAGTGMDDGRLTMVTTFGARFHLLSGLPSGFTPEGVSGPTAVADAHRTVYLLIGEGDVLGATMPPGQVPNPAGLSSPIFSSLLRAVFDPVPDGIREGFQLGPDEIQALADGREVAMTNDSGEQVELLLLTDFRDLVPDPFLGVRQANPFALALSGSLTADDLAELGATELGIDGANFIARLDPASELGQRLRERSTLYVVDAGMNTVTAVAASTGRAVLVSRLPPLPNPLFPDLGGPVMEPVPTGIDISATGDLLVTVLPGFPFPPGAGAVFRIDPTTGAFAPLVTGLNSALEVLEIDGELYVLELSTDFLAGLPGRLLHFVDPAGPPEVLAAPLIGPTGLIYERVRDELIVAETFTGLLKRVPRSTQ